MIRAPAQNLRTQPQAISLNGILHHDRLDLADLFQIRIFGPWREWEKVRRLMHIVHASDTIWVTRNDLRSYDLGEVSFSKEGRLHL